LLHEETEANGVFSIYGVSGRSSFSVRATAREIYFHAYHGNKARSYSLTGPSRGLGEIMSSITISLIVLASVFGGVVSALCFVPSYPSII
jgi:hypothetical protein